MAKKIRYPCASHRIFIPSNPFHSSLLFPCSISFHIHPFFFFSQKTMSLALGRNRGRSGFMDCVSICDRDFPADDDSDSSDSSSIGGDSSSSEDFSDREDSGDVAVQSSFKSPLDTMNDLEGDLPVKKGISKFYSGKSRSFTSLADAAAVTSMQEIVKPEDPYAKRRKNQLARNTLINRSCSYSDNIGGITSNNRGRGASYLALNSSIEEEGKSSTSVSPPVPRPAPPRSSANVPLPRPPRNAAWRAHTWSVSDMQSMAAEAREIAAGLAICSGN